MKLSTITLCVSLLILSSLPNIADASHATVTGKNNHIQRVVADSFKSIPPKEAKKLIDSRKDLLLLDVRTPQEVKQNGAIPGSRLVPLWAIFKNQLTLPKDKPIMLVCAIGGRSYAAGRMLKKYGYKEIYNLSGGISAWKKQGLPIQ